MDDPFPLDDAPALSPLPGGQWRLIARDRARADFGTPLGGLKFATLIEAQDHAKGKWDAGCSVLILNDTDGELHQRQPDGSWFCIRRGNVRNWMRGKRPSSAKLGAARVVGRER